MMRIKDAKLPLVRRYDSRIVYLHRGCGVSGKAFRIVPDTSSTIKTRARATVE